MNTSANRSVGRPREFDENYVFDISTEYLVARYNRNPKELQDRMAQVTGDPYNSIRQNRARFENEHVRLVLKLLERHPVGQQGRDADWQARFDADMWFLRHEPSIDITTLKGRQMAEKMNSYHSEGEAKQRQPWNEHALEYVRQQRIQHGSLYAFMLKIDYIIEAKQRVDKNIKTELAGLPPAFQDNGDDEA